MRLWISMMLIGLIGITPALAHPGGRDKNGGHYNRKSGVYHFHTSARDDADAERREKILEEKNGDSTARKSPARQQVLDDIKREAQEQPQASELRRLEESLRIQKQTLDARQVALDRREAQLVQRERELALKTRESGLPAPRVPTRRAVTHTPALRVPAGRTIPNVHTPRPSTNTGQYVGVLDAQRQVYDGDTLTNVRIKVASLHDRGEVWPGISITDDGVFATTGVRLAGIDTPEIRVRKTWSDGTPRDEASRERERDLAHMARNMVIYHLIERNDGRFVITNPKRGKYAGRIVGEVSVAERDGTLIPLADILLNAGLAKPYDGGTRPRWD